MKLVAVLSYNALCSQVSQYFMCSTRLTTMSQVTERHVSLQTQEPHGKPSVLSHIHSANAECQAIICSETALQFSEDLSNWFENQTVVIAQHQALRCDEWNLSWHVKLGGKERNDCRLSAWPCYINALKSQECLSLSSDSIRRTTLVVTCERKH